MNMNVRLKDLIGSDKAASLMLAFLPEECPYGGNHGGMCDWSCRDPYGEQGFVTEPSL